MSAVQTLPKDVSRLGQEVKLFGKWDTQECVPELSIYVYGKD
jgi:small subunit ribosomal protein S5e